MCKQGFNIRFCTCQKEVAKETGIIHNKNSRRYKRKFDKDEYLQKKIVWHLSKYITSIEQDIVGMMFMPSNKLTEELTSEFLLKELNNNLDLFDFDYLPTEGDNLVIRSEYLNKEVKGKYRLDNREYLSFVYKNNIWIEDVYVGFGNVIEEIAEGIIKIKK